MLVGQPAQRRPAPQRERAAEQLARPLGVVLAGALGGEALERGGVDGPGIKCQAVAARLRHQHVAAEHAAQARDQRLQRVRGVGGELVVPDRVDQRRGGHDAPAVERQARQQRGDPPAGGRLGTDIALQLERAEDGDPHGPRVPDGRAGTGPPGRRLSSSPNVRAAGATSPGCAPRGARRRRC